jgi:hypothetical protein
MNETLACFGCGRSLHVPDELRGQAVKCPACHHTFLVPETGVDSIPPSASAIPPPEVPPFQQPVYAETTAYERQNYPLGRNDYPGDSLWRQDGTEKPGKVQAIAIMTLAGGIFAILVGMGWACSCIGLAFPPTYYSFVVGIMAIRKGADLLSDTAYREKPPTTIAVMQIVNIISVDVVNLALGIITLVLLGDRDVKAYFRGR